MDLFNLKSPEIHSISLGYTSDTKSPVNSSEILSSENRSAVRLPYKSASASKSYPTRSSVVIEGEPVIERPLVKCRSPILEDDNSHSSRSSHSKTNSQRHKVGDSKLNTDEIALSRSTTAASQGKDFTPQYEETVRSLKEDSTVVPDDNSNGFQNEMVLNQEKIKNKTDLAKLINHQPNFRSLTVNPDSRKRTTSRFQKLNSFLSENNLTNFFRKTHERLFSPKSRNSPRDLTKNQSKNAQEIQLNLSSKSSRSIPESTFLAGSSNVSDITSGFLVKSSSVSEENGEVNQYFKLVQERLNQEYCQLKSKNESLTAQYESLKAFNDNYKKMVSDLEQSNTLLLQENKKYMQYSIRHQFLKLETTDLASKTNNCKRKLLDKEKLFNDFKQKFDELRLVKENLNKEKEIAFVEAQHNANQLSNMTCNIQELKGLRYEDVERKVFFNKLQQALGDMRVLFRVKPTNEPSCINYISTDKFLLNITKRGKKDSSKDKNKLCEFSRVFQPISTNADIYEEVLPLADLLVDGYNTCLITYGQTGSGKTYSLFGSETEPVGVAHKLLQHVLDKFAEENNWSYVLAISIIEIYRNKIFDLLRSCEVEVEDDGNRIVIKDTQEVLIDSYSEIVKRLNQANENRHSSSSRLNSNSSKGHLIIICRVEGHNKLEKSQTSHGVMMICDTAGFDYPTIDDYSHKKMSKQEQDITKGLKALGNVFLAKKDSKNVGYLYETSLLTQVLKPCLSNRTKCSLLATSHCNSDNFPSIFQTIQFCFNAMPTNHSSDHFQPWVLGE